MLVELASQSLPSGFHRDAVIVLCHEWGGGTEVHIQSLARRIADDDHTVFYFQMRREGDGLKLSIHDQETYNFDHLDMDDAYTALHYILGRYHVRFVHMHSLVSFPEKYVDFFMRFVKTNNVPYYCTIHDYHWVCPNISLTDFTGQYCGEPTLSQCQACVNRTFSRDERVHVQSYREKHGEILKGAETCFVPNKDVKKRMKRYYDDIQITVRPHPATEEALAFSARAKEAVEADSLVNDNDEPADDREELRIGLLGAIGLNKGAYVLEELARVASEKNYNVKFVVIGFTCQDEMVSAVRQCRDLWKI